jgi:hypothetical protein
VNKVKKKKKKKTIYLINKLTIIIFCENIYLKPSIGKPGMSEAEIK